MKEEKVPWRLGFLEVALMGREVEGEDRSRCLSRTSLIRFRSSDLEAETVTEPPPRSLYIPNPCPIPNSLLLRLSLGTIEVSQTWPKMKRKEGERVKARVFDFLQHNTILIVTLS